MPRSRRAGQGAPAAAARRRRGRPADAARRVAWQGGPCAISSSGDRPSGCRPTGRMRTGRGRRLPPRRMASLSQGHAVAGGPGAAAACRLPAAASASAAAAAAPLPLALVAQARRLLREQHPARYPANAHKGRAERRHRHAAARAESGQYAKAAGPEEQAGEHLQFAARQALEPHGRPPAGPYKSQARGAPREIGHQGGARQGRCTRLQVPGRPRNQPLAGPGEERSTAACAPRRRQPGPARPAARAPDDSCQGCALPPLASVLLPLLPLLPVLPVPPAATRRLGASSSAAAASPARPAAGTRLAVGNAYTTQRPRRRAPM